jgi:hypothetical protein
MHAEDIPAVPVDHQSPESTDVCFKEYNALNKDSFRINDHNLSAKRLKLTSFLKNRGWTRPCHAVVNAKV